MPASRLRSCTLMMVMLLLAPAPALADGAGGAPKGNNRALALEKAKEGLEFYRAERWQDAYDRFREAEHLYHAPSVVIYLARCQQKLGKLAEARILYEPILTEPLGKDAPTPFVDAYSDAQRELEEVRSKLAPPAPSVPAAPHQAGTTEQAPPHEVGTTEQKGSLLPGGLALGLGGVSLAVGAITGGLSLSKVSDLESICPNKNCRPEEQGKADAAKTLGNVSTATFILGGAAIAAGVVLVVVRPGGGPKPAASGGVSRVKPQLSLGASVGLGRLDLRLSF
jgi:tetratricopeptide (TPR) repeat protein